jgi:hypothetical protein
MIGQRRPGGQDQQDQRGQRGNITQKFFAVLLHAGRTNGGVEKFRSSLELPDKL